LIAVAAVVGGVWWQRSRTPEKVEPELLPAPQSETGPSQDQFQGIIEVGSTGVKALVLRFDPTSGQFDRKPLFQKDRIANLGTLDSENHSFRPENVKKMEAALKDFVKTMEQDHKVPPEQVHIVFSSGVFSAFKDSKAIEAGKKLLGKAVQATVKRQPDFISVQDEVRYTIIACIPPRELSESVLLDVGGGNTKGGYFNADGKFHSIAVELGTKSFSNAILVQAKKTGKPFAEVAASLREPKLIVPLRKQVDSDPGLLERRKVYLLGGIVWALANFTHPANRGQRVKLAAGDIDLFAKLVKEKPAALRSKLLAQVNDEKARAAAEKDIKKIQEEVFKKTDRLIAGAEILAALSSVMDLKGREIVFYRDGHVAWPRGYLMKKKGK
jgi:exopolyphosphatase/pppGpp-phosphohydrolase